MCMTTANPYHKKNTFTFTVAYVKLTFKDIPHVTSTFVLYEASWLETVDEDVINKRNDPGSEFQAEEVKIRVNAARAVEEFNSKQ